MERRKFLRVLGLTGVSALAAPVAGRASAGDFPGDPDPFGVLHDSTLCIGCRRCEAGCAKVNALPAPGKPFDDLAVLEETRGLDTAFWTVVNKYPVVVNGQAKNVFRKQQCNHCLQPACVSACFAGALSKSPYGPVTYDPALCVGCRYCMIACPYYVPAYDYHNVWNPLMYKCTMCAPRIGEGLLPGCVEDCPAGALIFGRRTDLLRLAWEKIRRMPDVYVEHVYGEHEMGGASWLYIGAVPAQQLGLPVLGGTPAPDLTAGFRNFAVMLAGLGPVLLGGICAMNRRRGRDAATAGEDGKSEDAGEMPGRMPG